MIAAAQSKMFEGLQTLVGGARHCKEQFSGSFHKAHGESFHHRRPPVLLRPPRTNTLGNPKVASLTSERFIASVARQRQLRRNTLWPLGDSALGEGAENRFRRNRPTRLTSGLLAACSEAGGSITEKDDWERGECGEGAVLKQSRMRRLAATQSSAGPLTLIRKEPNLKISSASSSLIQVSSKPIGLCWRLFEAASRRPAEGRKDAGCCKKG